MQQTDSVETLASVMTKDPICLSASQSVAEAASLMCDEDVGAVLIEQDGQLCGIVTDRDIVVRVVAAGLNPEATKLSSVCSSELAVLSPDDEIFHAVELMRKKGIRRIPVKVDGSLVGIVSLGDLALKRDPASALGGISGAPPNR